MKIKINLRNKKHSGSTGRVCYDRSTTTYLADSPNCPNCQNRSNRSNRSNRPNPGRLEDAPNDELISSLWLQVMKLREWYISAIFGGLHRPAV